VVHLLSEAVLTVHQESINMNQEMVNVVFVALRHTEAVLIVNLVSTSIRKCVGVTPIKIILKFK